MEPSDEVARSIRQAPISSGKLIPGHVFAASGGAGDCITGTDNADRMFSEGTFRILSLSCPGKTTFRFGRAGWLILAAPLSLFGGERWVLTS